MNGEPNTQDAFLFSPSSSYPRPLACLVDRDGDLVHAWSNTTGQPNPATDPPSYLRGWNHVELAADGSLYAMVPLHALLKLRPNSSLAWKTELPVHHDLDFGPGGEIYALTERPRTVRRRGGRHVVLDNFITIISPEGNVMENHSLYDLLTTQPAIRSLIDSRVARRITTPGSTAPTNLDVLCDRTGRDASRMLRGLPGSPCDILHANTLEILHTHPHGLWNNGDVLVSLRDLDLIAVLDLRAQQVRWWWGPQELSAQHQPSALPNGNLLVFDNGQKMRRSRPLELDPVTGAVVWQYTADPPQALFSPMAGGCERLPSGNVLISDAQAGRAIEVTSGGHITWTLQIHTRQRSASANSRCEIYRIAAAPTGVTVHLSGGASHARHLAWLRVQCRTDRAPLPAGTSP
ncbi:arylsulfotransferase family protein [Actinomadura sp. WMMB 499]|uniref:arylsulfotransferase family protein n=1 Tax=Actinomadura sp. WMMB 499 TaxID=1219491 RepID=UPI001244C41A|nr:arylsulfotransferase family protein [Actinomadura sp. WMMB 499]QFG23729.1 hypothetical protein F7P10_23985 [Actinomadura sp. WMMB 499]